MRTQVVFYLNGQKHEVGGAQAGLMLADYLRYEKGLTGTKVVCAEGDCGACTVLRRFSPTSDRFLPVNSCITTIAQMDGSSLVTVDALADGEMTPVQKSMVSCHASQCGFCTPGFVMALTGLVEKKLCADDAQPISKQEAKNWFTGNLCRCTGYEPILDAATSVDLSACAPMQERFWSQAQERELKAAMAKPMRIQAENYEFYAPRTAKDAAGYLRKNPDARILAAGTDLGVVVNKRKLTVQKALSLHLIPGLFSVRVARKRVRVGARVTLSQLRSELKDKVPEFSRFLDLFASPQIKNSATLVGNVCNASPIADTPPFLLTAGATLELVGPRGQRKVAIEEFYLGYRKTALKPGEVVVAIEFDIPSAQETLGLFKVSQRKDLDISTVNTAFRATWNRDKTALREIRIALGGMAATPVRLKKTEALLTGAPLDSALLGRAIQIFHSEMEPISDLRGSAAFRRVASENLFYKFFRERLGVQA